MDPPLAQAEPISSGAGANCDELVKKVGKNCTTATVAGDSLLSLQVVISNDTTLLKLVSV